MRGGRNGPKFEPLESRVLLTGDFPITQVLTGAESLAGATFNPNEEAAIAPTGEVVVVGVLSGSGDRAVAAGTPGNLRLVLRAHTHIPGLSDTAIYTDTNFPDRPTIASGGVVGYANFVSNGSEFGSAVWVDDGSGLTLRSGSGLTATVDTDDDSGVSPNGNAVYVTATGLFRKVMIDSQEVLTESFDPTIAFDGRNYRLSAPVTGVKAVNASNQFVLDVTLRDGVSFDEYDSVLVVGPGGVLRGVTEQTFDTGISGATAADLNALDINGAGQALIEVMLSGVGVTTANDQSMYFWDSNGALTLVAREGSTIPGTNLAQLYGTFASSDPRFALSGSGQVIANIQDEINFGPPDILATWSAGTWNVIAVTDDTHAPGTPTGVEFISLSGAAINDRGTVVFSAQLGGSIQFIGREGLWAYADGELKSVVIENDVLQTSSGPTAVTLESLFGPLDFLTLGTGENGRRTPLTDDDRVVFSTKGQGVFIADVSGPAQPGEIHGVVWNDVNGDGALVLEPGVQGVSITLENTSAQVVAGPITTDANGGYRFQNVQPGEYRVRITLPPSATFTPTGGDAEIGGSGLSAVIILPEGGDIEADAGLILPGPVATLLLSTTGGLDDEGNLDLTSFVGTDNPIPLDVEYFDSDRVDESFFESTDPLEKTSLAIFRFGSQSPVGFAQFVSVLNKNGIDDETETVRYAILPPFGDKWLQSDLGDYTLLTTPPTAKDTTGKSGEIGALVGLFSLVDKTPPTFVGPIVSPTAISTSTSPLESGRVFLSVALDDAFAVDDATVVEGSLVVRREGGDPVPMELFGYNPDTNAADYVFRAPPGGFDNTFEGDYDIFAATGAAAIKDEAGNAVSDQSRIAGFVIDFTPPVPNLVGSPVPATNAATFDFEIGWSDALAGVDDPSLAAAELRVKKPDGQYIDEPLIRLSTFGFRMSAPGDVWDEIDHGTYTIELANEEVKDTVGNKTTEGTAVGAFSFLPPPTETGTNEGKPTTEIRKTDGSGLSVKQKAVNLFIDFVAGPELTKVVGKNKVLYDNVVDIIKLTIDPDNPGATLDVIQLLRGAQQQAVGAIEALGHMRHVVAPGVDLVTNAVFPGLDKLVLGDVRDDHTITIGAPDDVGKPFVDITLDRVANTDIISQTPIGTLTVTEWIDDDGDPDVITAPWIGKIVVKGDKKANLAGDFMADLELTGAGAPKGISLGSATVAGDLIGAVWDLGAGAAGTVTAKKTVTNWDLFAKTFKTITMGDAAGVNLATEDDAGDVKFTRWLGGSLFGKSVKSLTASGDKKLNLAGDLSIALNLLGHTDLKKLTLGALKLAGSLRDSTWNIAGAAGAMTIAGNSGGAGAPVSITATTIKSLAINGNASELSLNLTQAYDAVKPKLSNLGSLTIKGTANGLNLTSADNA